MAAAALEAAERVCALQQAIVQNKRDSKQVYQRLSRCRARWKHGGLGVAARKTTVAVYVLSNGSSDLSHRVACMLSTIKDPQAPGYPTKALVEELLLAIPEAEFTTLDAKAAGRAQKFLASAATAEWVREMNISHGVAPSSMNAFLHWEQELHGSKLEFGIPKKRSVNQWAKRWRGHWGLRRKTLRQGVRHNPETLKQKAGPVFLACYGPISGPISGVEIRTQNWFHHVPPSSPAVKTMWKT